MSLLLLVASAFAADAAPPVALTEACAAVVPPSAVAGLLSEGEAALIDLDEEGFAAAFTAAEASLPCVGAPLSAADAATWHRVAGVKAFFGGDKVAAAAHFRAYVSAQPGGTLPADYAGEGGALLTAFRAAVVVPPGEDRPVTLPRGLTAVIDGAPAAAVPGGLAAVVQVTDAGGALLATAQVGPTTAPIDLSAVPGGLPDPPPTPVTQRERPRRAEPEVVEAPPVAGVESAVAVDASAVPVEAPAASTPTATTLRTPPPARVAREKHPVGLVAAAAGSAVLSGGSYALSWVLRDRFDDLEESPAAMSDLPALRTGTNVSAIAAPVLGGVALGLGVVAVVRW